MTEEPLITPKNIEEEFGRVDWEKVLKDEIVAEIKEQHDHHLLTTLYGSSFADGIMIHPEAYKYLTEATDTSFYGKIKYGWKLFMLSWSDWKDAMTSDDYVEEFFEYLGSCEVL